MATSIVPQSRRILPNRRFYFAMASAMALIAALGFGPTYVEALAPPGVPFWVHLHGAAMATWIALFVAQTWFAGHGELAIHRSLGIAGLVLVVLIVPLGLATTFLAVRRGATPPFLTPAFLLAYDFLSVVTFGVLVSLALLLRHRSEWHKRLLLSATILLMAPALARIFVRSPLEPIWYWAGYAVMIALILAGMANDYRQTRRVHPAYAVGMAFISLVQVAAPMLAQSEAVTALVRYAST